MCGIIGIVSNKSKNKMGHTMFDGLLALQHRGQESAGIAWSSKEHIYVYKDIGVVHEIFAESILDQIKSNLAIGHVRYSTVKTEAWGSSQPMLHKHHNLTMAHNGQVDCSDIIDSLEFDDPIRLSCKNKKISDSSILFKIIASTYNGTVFDIEKLKSLLSKVKGAYSILMMNKSSVYCIRDPYGYHPLTMGLSKNQEDIIIASEDSTINSLGGSLLRDIEPGEILKITPGDQPKTIGYITKKLKILRKCAFEQIYISRGDSSLDGLNTYQVRKNLGMLLAKKFKEAKLDTEIVMPVPDSSIPYALGFAEEVKIPYSQPIIRNNYVGRSFIKPSNSSRLRTLRSKFNIVGHLIRGKKITIVDDSIVRGNTQHILIQLIKEHSPAQIHVCIGSPPIKHECYYGVDIANKKELIADHYSIEEIRKRFMVDSLIYLTLEELQSTLGENPESNFCFSCINGKYL